MMTPLHLTLSHVAVRRVLKEVNRLQHLEESERVVQITPDAVTHDGEGHQG